MEEPSTASEPRSPDAERLFSDWNPSRVEQGPPLDPRLALELLDLFEQQGRFKDATLAGLKGLQHHSGKNRKTLTHRLLRLAERQVRAYSLALRNQGRMDSLFENVRNPEAGPSFSPYAISLLGELGETRHLADLGVIRDRCMELKKRTQAAAAITAIKERQSL